MSNLVYFDGACHVCAHEIERYQKRDGLHRFKFIDISAPNFSAENEGLDPIAVNQAMHVRDEKGDIHVGLDALIYIWQNLPRFKWMSHAAQIPLIYPLAKLGYATFAHVRRYLPKRKSSICDDQHCLRK